MRHVATASCVIVLLSTLLVGAELFVMVAPGVRLFVRDEGRGAPVVVLHGGPGLDSNYLADDLVPLAARRRVVFFDQRGAGRSSLANGVTAETLVEDLEALRRHFRIDRLTLLGHSWGAGLAALYAMTHPARVERLVLVGSMPVQARWLSVFSTNLRDRLSTAEQARLDEADAAWETASGAAGQIERCRAYWAILQKAYYANPAAASRSRGNLCAPPGAGLASGRRVNGSVWASLGEFDWRPRLASVRAPTLLVHGDRDPIPLDAAREWRAAIPSSRLLVVPDAGHMPYVEQPQLFFAAVQTFLDGNWPADAR
ncbi:MAG: alpha/beta fold hydrolase [Acidobacteria bacterium]|nr:alpha/beta fold hydrolase [Acidobacteriota bacterium]